MDRNIRIMQIGQFADRALVVGYKILHHAGGLITGGAKRLVDRATCANRAVESFADHIAASCRP